MATCKDCLHNEACDIYAGNLNKDGAEKCRCFKKRNRFVELPCKVGDTVYYITGIGYNLVKPAKVKEIILGENGIKDLYVQGNGHNFENSFDIFFLTREEAERALKERESDD